MLGWSNSLKDRKVVLLAVEAGIDEIIVQNLKAIEPYSNEDEWEFAVINHSDLLDTVKNPDVVVLSRFLTGAKPSEILKIVKDKFFLSHVVLLTGEKNEQGRKYASLAKQMGFENLVVGELPGEAPYYITDAIRYTYQEIKGKEDVNISYSDNMAPIRVETVRDKGLVVASAGAKGGIGKTSVAAGVTLTLARLGIGVTAIDYDYSRQDLSAFFKVPEFHRFIIENYSDEEIKRSIVPVNNNIYLLPASGKKAPIDFPSTEEVERVLEIAKDTSPVIVVDTPSDLNCSHTSAILQNADVVLVSIDQTAFTDQDIFDYGSFLLEIGVNPEKVKIIVNRYSKKFKPVHEILRLFNQGIRGDVKVIATIPNQYEKYVLMSYKGQIPGVMDRKSPWRDIVSEIGIEIPQKSRFRLKREA